MNETHAGREVLCAFGHQAIQETPVEKNRYLYRTGHDSQDDKRPPRTRSGMAILHGDTPEEDLAKALLILDAQNICPARPRAEPGLAVSHGDYPSLSGKEVAIPLLATAQAILRHGGIVFATRGRDEGISSLCVRGSSGADLNPRLRLPKRAVVVSPSDGGNRLLDHRNRRGRSLRQLLDRGNVSELFIGGLTTRVEIERAVADLCEGGIRTTVLADAIFALDAGPGEKPSMSGFAHLGARIVSTGQAIMEQFGWRDEYPAPSDTTSIYPPARDTWSSEEPPRVRPETAGKAPQRREPGGWGWRTRP